MQRRDAEALFLRFKFFGWATLSVVLGFYAFLFGVLGAVGGALSVALKDVAATLVSQSAHAAEHALRACDSDDYGDEGLEDDEDEDLGEVLEFDILNDGTEAPADGQE